MALINIRDLCIQFGEQPLIDGANLAVNKGERLCLIGRNGTGKSTLLKLIAQMIEADDGSIDYQQGLTTQYLQQQVNLTLSGSVFDVVCQGLGPISDLLKRYQDLSQQMMTESSDSLMDELGELQHDIEQQNGWNAQQNVSSLLTKMSLNPDDDINQLSGGLKRRVLFAQALVSDPDVLLLDEPTNHLDIEAVMWLEQFLLNDHRTLIFISHDRAFVEKLATRIIELDRGKLVSWPGDYPNYLIQKQHALEVEERENALFDKRLAGEEVWIRQGIKARRTRNEGRVRALVKMRELRQQRRYRSGNVQIEQQQSAQTGKIVFELNNINQQYDQKPVIKDFSTAIFRGDKIGILGPNGCGKSTLINIIIGKLTPDQGDVKQGSRLNIAYFDQYRQQLDENQTAQENVGQGSDHVTINGKSRHIISYLEDFLFSPQRARAPISALSGGERNRLLLAKLFTQAFNVLIMDEPTNDLDIETLELLEEQLCNYQGTLLLVSHDREFINNTITSTLVFEGNGKINEYVGGYDDWLRQKPRSIQSDPKPTIQETLQKTQKPTSDKGRDHQKQLQRLLTQIERLEKQREQLQQRMAQADYYQSAQNMIDQDTSKLQQLDDEIEVTYKQWQKLDSA